MRYRIAAIAAALACAPALAQDAGERARTLAAERGCNTCHQEKTAPPEPTVPLAPSWREIAARYRGQAGAEERLAAIVIGGSDRRHWKNRSAFAGMLPNEVSVTPDEARLLVRWILAR